MVARRFIRLVVFIKSQVIVLVDFLRSFTQILGLQISTILRQVRVLTKHLQMMAQVLIRILCHLILRLLSSLSLQVLLVYFLLLFRNQVALTRIPHTFQFWKVNFLLVRTVRCAEKIIITSKAPVRSETFLLKIYYFFIDRFK